MSQDLRRQMFSKSVIRRDRDATHVDADEKLRRHPELRRAESSARERRRKAKWARAHPSVMREHQQRYRARHPDRQARRWKEWQSENRLYRAAYMRARRRLQGISPPLPAEELRRRCRWIAIFLASRISDETVE